MGIQRLLHDLLPYAERVVLGVSPRTATGTTDVEALIVDGPSLVYFVYNRLLAYHCLNSLIALAPPPTYAEINQAVLHLLDDLQTQGITIAHIFFDGGLPKSKRDVRLDRMDKLRQQLDIFRKAHADFPPWSASSVGVRDFEKALWATSGISTRKSTLPAPPFMVASVIEALSTADSPWSRSVHIVPGEADLYCALAAQTSAGKVAVLTNDADLAVHELGGRGCVALLHSLEKKQRKSAPRGLEFTVLCLDPAHTASRMNVDSLFAFGFERFLDSNASTAIIRERARNASSLHQMKSEHTTFLEEFLPSMPVSANSQLNLNSLDPRTAELVVGLDDSPYVYLTPILEDPQRDSSWSYGAHIRQLGYTLLSSSTRSRNARLTQPAAPVTEYARKGQRISSATVTALKPSDAIPRMAELESLLAIYISPPSPGAAVNDRTALPAWYALAIHLVHQEKVKLDKSPLTLTQVARLFGLPQTAALTFKIPPRISWEDIHLLANIQAVLYSLRMLYQITGYIMNQMQLPSESAAMASPHPGNSEGLPTGIAALHSTLSNMPSIADLLLDITHLRQKLGEADIETRNMTIRCLKDVLEPKSLPELAIQHSVRDEGNQDTSNEHDEAVWATAKPKKKKKRKRGRQLETQAIQTKSTNIFKLLSDDPG
ncbi:hypothetical protein A1O7_06209 [Cladophialophora yegresii CBS 114405]|uniref:Asteroid domain-containing protein n=1 Tax=Cladophialophora yegresii CBS 114405 TaxID=1182544 RepID=W9WJW0_9EURO|nr:uncharacterized protein A1O7_06209 [Cladophialophora yegresii CBS 114405]EXJ58779.1 hypothetical protein A1O7_06209 [Cladophialophora yegresii CBS 114405]